VYTCVEADECSRTIFTRASLFSGTNAYAKKPHLRYRQRMAIQPAYKRRSWSCNIFRVLLCISNQTNMPLCYSEVGNRMALIIFVRIIYQKNMYTHFFSLFIQIERFSRVSFTSSVYSRRDLFRTDWVTYTFRATGRAKCKSFVRSKIKSNPRRVHVEIRLHVNVVAVFFYYPLPTYVYQTICSNNNANAAEVGPASRKLSTGLCVAGRRGPRGRGIVVISSVIVVSYRSATAYIYIYIYIYTYYPVYASDVYNNNNNNNNLSDIRGRAQDADRVGRARARVPVARARKPAPGGVGNA